MQRGSNDIGSLDEHAFRYWGGVRGRFIKFYVLVAAVAVVVLCVFLAWSYQTKGEENMRRALAEARTLNTEIGAAWDYIDSVQPILTRMSGDPLSGGVYCVVAAKDIAERFSDQSEYSIRYVRTNPRNAEDEPDDFEQQALVEFEQSNATEYYAMVRGEGGATFRYVIKLTVDSGCLPCHGSPAGEKDVAGYYKEGMSEGDVAGAVSIVMPMDEIFAEARNDLVRTVVFFCVLMGIMGILLALALRSWVARPTVAENNQLIRESHKKSRIITAAVQELRSRPLEVFATGELRVNLRTGEVFLRGEKVDLTLKEARIVVLLAEHPDETFSKEDLIRAIWGEEYVGTSISISAYMRRIRSKIEDDSSSPRYIQTIRGKGYKMHIQEH